MNRERLVSWFTQLAELDSPSFGERAVADWIKKELKEQEFEVTEDGAGKTLQGTAGNIYGFRKGTLPGPPILFSAHMDTVQPACGKKAAVHPGASAERNAFDGSQAFLETPVSQQERKDVPKPDGMITSGGDTVLGADDICGIVEILEGIRSLTEQQLPHRDIEVLFPVAEEVYIKGTKEFDFSKIRAKQAYVLDLGGPVGRAALQAPSILSFELTIYGRAAHAGFEPEKGIHAIALMSHGIAASRQGHLDSDTTLNIGMVQGGSGTNIVPERCSCCGEVRSYVHNRAKKAVTEWKTSMEKALKGSGATLKLREEVHMEAYRIEPEEKVVKDFEAACRKVGLQPELTATFGGSDNNNFVKNGIRGIVLSCGMYQSHSVSEYTTIHDLEQGSRLVAELAAQAEQP